MSIALAVVTSQVRALQHAREKMIFGSAGCCLSKSVRALCTPEVFSKDYVAIERIKPCNVRVLLDQKKLKDGPLWVISGESIVGYSRRAGEKEERIRAHECTISVHRGQIHVNGTRCQASRVDFCSDKGPIRVNGKKYSGTFTIVIHDAMVDLINNVALEEYVCCVLQAESWPGWPLEVNKALAIAIRTYVAAKIFENKHAHRKLPYHIKNTNIHQTYNGLHEYPSLERAAQETAGIIMTYQHKPIVAMFDACCGGIIPAAIKDIDFLHVPYLKRDYACTFCSSCRLFQYTSQYNVKEMSRLLKNRGIFVGLPRDIQIIEKDRAGVVQRVLVTGDKGKAQLSKHQVYGLCKKIKSFAFTIRKSGGLFIFDGYGFGHHLGLCQWGAREMVARGWRCKGILHFYYPGITFMKIAHG